MNIGSMTATLGVDTRGVANAQQAMLNLQKQVLQSVRTMNASLETMNATLQRTAVATATVGRTSVSSFARTTTALDGLTTSLTRSAQRFRTFGYLATAVVTLPIVLMGKAALNAAKDFEFSMNKIVSLVGLARDQVKAMSSAVLDMSTEVARKPQELADALYFITSAGFKDPAQALNILNISAKAASVGLGETKDVANLLTSAMNAYRTSNLTAARSADIVVAAVREGKIEADGFNSAMQSVIPIASALGISFAEVAGTMAAMSLQGASAANSATYLKGVLNSLLKIKADSAADKALRQFGFTADMLLEQLKQPGGLMEVLIKLKELSEKSTGNMFLKTIFRDIRAMTGALSLTGDNLEYNKQVIDAVVNSYGSLAKANQQTADTIQRRMDVALASANRSMIVFGQTIAKAIVPVIEYLVKLLNELVDWYRGLSESMQRNIVIILAITAALGPLALAISLVKYGLAGLLTAGKGLVYLTNVVKGLTGSFGALKVATIANPLLTRGLVTAGGVLTNPYVLLGVGVVALTGYLIHLKRKTEDAALAQSALHTTMVNVNGEIKKMKDLTAIDYTAMDEKTNLATNAQAWKTYYKAMQDLANIKKWSGRSDKKWEEGKVPVRWRGAFEQVMQTAEMAKVTITATDLALMNLYQDIMAQEEVKRKTVLQAMKEDAEKAVEALERLNEEWERINQKFRPDKMFIPKITDKLSNLKYQPLKSIPSATGLKYDKNLFGATKKLPGGGFMPEMKGDFTETAETLNIMNKELAFIAIKEAAMNDVLGKRRDLYNDIQAQISARSAALEALLNNPEMGQTATDAIRDQIEALGKLEEEFRKLERTKQIYASLAQGATDMAFAVGKAFVSSGNAAEVMMGIILQTGQQIIGILLAEAMAAYIAGKAAIPGGLIIAAIGMGALIALFESGQSQAKSAAGMAQGGIVPAGYPNDTYPARLTSGEMVIPPGKLDGVGGMNIQLEVDEIRIKGSDIVIALRRVGAYN